MNRTGSHRITICTSCHHKDETCRPGYELINRLRAGIEAVGSAVTEEFEIAGTARMDGCDRSCTMAYHATRKASYLFGDVDPDEDIESLMEFARQYAVLHNGWYSSVDRLGQLRKATLACIPATIMALEEKAERLS